MTIDDGITRDPFVEEVLEPLREYLCTINGLEHGVKLVAILDYLMNDDFADSINDEHSDICDYRHALIEKIKPIR